MAPVYGTTQADRWDAGLTDDPDERPDEHEMSLLRRAHYLLDAR